MKLPVLLDTRSSRVDLGEKMLHAARGEGITAADASSDRANKWDVKSPRVRMGSAARCFFYDPASCRRRRGSSELPMSANTLFQFSSDAAAALCERALHCTTPCSPRLFPPRLDCPAGLALSLLRLAPFPRQLSKPVKLLSLARARVFFCSLYF